MIIQESSREVLAKLVCLSAAPELGVSFVEQVHARLAPGLATELTRLRGDGQILSRANELVYFEFSLASKSTTRPGLRLRFHLYTLRASPTEADLAFLLKGVDVLLFMRSSNPRGEDQLYEAAWAVMGGPPPFGLVLLDETHGPVPPSRLPQTGWTELRTHVGAGDGVVEALKEATGELLRWIRAGSAGP